MAMDPTETILNLSKLPRPPFQPTWQVPVDAAAWFPVNQPVYSAMDAPLKAHLFDWFWVKINHVDKVLTIKFNTKPRSQANISTECACPLGQLRCGGTWVNPTPSAVRTVIKLCPNFYPCLTLIDQLKANLESLHRQHESEYPYFLMWGIDLAVRMKTHCTDNIRILEELERRHHDPRPQLIAAGQPILSDIPFQPRWQVPPGAPAWFPKFQPVYSEMDVHLKAHLFDWLWNKFDLKVLTIKFNTTPRSQAIISQECACPLGQLRCGGTWVNPTPSAVRTAIKARPNFYPCLGLISRLKANLESLHAQHESEYPYFLMWGIDLVVRMTTHCRDNNGILKELVERRKNPILQRIAAGSPL